MSKVDDVNAGDDRTVAMIIHATRTRTRYSLTNHVGIPVRVRWGGRQHGVVPDLLWDDVKNWFDPESNGALPDVCVADTNLAGWQAVVDLVRSRGWAYEYSIDGRLVRVPGRVEDMLRSQAESAATLKVWPAPAILVIFTL